MIALTGFGVGGNLPVDGALFLEFLPGKSQWLLTLLSVSGGLAISLPAPCHRSAGYHAVDVDRLSARHIQVWWAIGQVVASLISWAFLAKYSCDPNLVGTVGYICDKSNNSGWRYSYYTLGAMMFFLSILRVFVLPMDESPKFLIAKGRDADAVAVIHRIAKLNGKTTDLTVERLHAAAQPYFKEDGDDQQATTKFSVWELLRLSMKDMKGEHFKGLFATPRLAYSTSLIIFICE